MIFGKGQFCVSRCVHLHHLCHVIQGDMLIVHHSHAHSFVLYTHFFSSALISGIVSGAKLTDSLVLSSSDLVIAMDAMPSCWTSYLHDCVLSPSFSVTWLGSMSNDLIALQKLLAVVLRLHMIAFCLSGKMVALHVDNYSAKIY